MMLAPDVDVAGFDAMRGGGACEEFTVMSQVSV
jgi:hypothetical protein